MISDAEFSKASSTALETLYLGMDRVADEHEVEILFQGGVLTLELEEPATSKIIISPNSSARQIWISAQTTSFKLDWSAEISKFIFPATGETLNSLLGRLLAEELGTDTIPL